MTMTPLDSEAVPATLLEYDQWVCWRVQERDGSATKIPVTPETGRFASTTDPETWTTFETARERVVVGDEDGIGFVFTDADSIVGVDLDDCRDPETGQPDRWAKDVIDALDSYTEVSPSGTGYHVLVTGALPKGRNRNGDLELYDTARFFTVTGDHVQGTPETIRDRPTVLASVHDEYVAADEDGSNDPPIDAEGNSAASSASGQGSMADATLVEKATHATNGEKFRRLWRGSTSGYESHSEADMALCSLLAFWTGGDRHQIDRLFRDSGLMRGKWDEVHFADGSTYGEKTIERAIAGTSEFYDPPAATVADDETVTTDATNATDTSPIVERDPAASGGVSLLDRIAGLERRLVTVQEEKEQLDAALAAERERRHQLQAELEAERERECGWSLSDLW